MIKLGVKGLAKFMTATFAQQRKVLRDYKYPDEEGTAQAAYYRDAQNLVAEYHRLQRPTQWLRDKATILQTAAAGIGGRIGTRLRHNSRGINDYATHFAGKKYDVLPEHTFFLTFGDVRIGVRPDLHVRDNNRERFLKLEFAKDEPDERTIKIISQLMFEAALAAQLAVTSRDVLYIDVARGKAHRGARVGSRMKGELEAACANISALWNGITP